MRIGGIKPTTRSDVPEAPPWIDKALMPLNSQVKDLTTAAQNRLSPNDNFNCEVRDAKLEHNVSKDITLMKVKGKPQFIVVQSQDGFAVPKMEILTEDRIRLTLFFVGTAPTGEVPVKLWIQGP